MTKRRLTVSVQTEDNSSAHRRFDEARQQLIRVLVHHTIHIAERANLIEANEPKQRLLEYAYSQWTYQAVFEWRPAPCEEGCPHSQDSFEPQQDYDISSENTATDPSSPFTQEYGVDEFGSDQFYLSEHFACETAGTLERFPRDIPFSQEQASELLSPPDLANYFVDPQTPITMSPTFTLMSASVSEAFHTPSHFFHQTPQDPDRTPSLPLGLYCAESDLRPSMSSLEGRSTETASIHSDVQAGPPLMNTPQASRSREEKHARPTPEERLAFKRELRRARRGNSCLKCASWIDPVSRECLIIKFITKSRSRPTNSICVEVAVVVHPHPAAIKNSHVLSMTFGFLMRVLSHHIS